MYAYDQAGTSAATVSELPLIDARSHHNATVSLCTVAVCITAFANSFSLLRAPFAGVFIVALVIPFLQRSCVRQRRFILAGALVFGIWNLLTLVIHPLDMRSFYNGLIAIACVILFVGLTRLSPNPPVLVALVHQMGWVVRALLLIGLVFQFAGSQLNWNSKTGMLWLLLFFVFIDPKVHRWTKLVFFSIWSLQAYAIDDRAYLFVPIFVFATYAAWPFLTRVKTLGALVMVTFFAILALLPVAYVRLSASQYRQPLDDLALQYSGGRFFSGRDVIWSHMLNAASDRNMVVGGGHAISPDGVFAHDVSAHNTYISVLARTGIIGLILLFLLFTAVFITYARCEDPVIRWSAAFTVGILFKQSTEMSLLGNNVAIASLSWLIVAFGLIHLSSRLQGTMQKRAYISVLGHREGK